MGDNKRYKIAIFASNIHREYPNLILKGIMSQADKYGFDVYLFKTDASFGDAERYNKGEYMLFSVANLSEFDGIIIFKNLITDTSIRKLLIERIISSGVPSFSVDAHIDGMMYVGGENTNCMCELVTHLIKKHNCKTFAFVGGLKDNSDSSERILGFEMALEENDISFTENAKIYNESFTKTAGLKIGEELASKVLPDAIVCATDWIAQGVIISLNKHGIRVPDDVIVTGFDYDFDSRNFVPRITSISRDFESMGIKIIDSFNNIFNGGLKEDLLVESVPKYMESCGCIGEEGNDIADIRFAYSNYKSSTLDSLLDILSMKGELSIQKNLISLNTILQQHVQFFSCRGFYLCLSEEIIKGFDLGFEKVAFTNKMPANINPYLAFERGEVVDYKTFDINQMIPDIPNIDGFSHLYEFSSLHFKDHFIGYIVIDRCESGREEILNDLFVSEVNNCLNLLIMNNRLSRALYKFEGIMDN